MTIKKEPVFRTDSPPEGKALFFETEKGWYLGTVDGFMDGPSVFSGGCLGPIDIILRWTPMLALIEHLEDNLKKPLDSQPPTE